MAQLVIPAIALGISALTSFALRSPKAAQDVTRQAPTINLQTPRSTYGSPIPKVYGKVRLEGNKIFPNTIEKMYEVVTEVTTEEVDQPSGKGGGGSSTSTVTTETKKVYGTWASLLCEGQVTLDKVIINGKQMDSGSGFFQEYVTFFDGTQTAPWDRMNVLADTPANDIVYHKLAYIGFDNVPLAEYGNLIPQQVAAIVTDAEFGEFPFLSDVVQDICVRAGLQPSDVDVTELSDMTLRHGFILPNGDQSYRKSLSELMQLYLFGVAELPNGVLKFKKLIRPSGTPLSIPESDFIVGNDSLELFERSEDRSQDIPSQITFKFFNINQKYQQDVVVEKFYDFVKEDNLNIDSHITSNAYHIKENVMKLLRYLFITKRVSYKFSLPIKYANQLTGLELVELPNGEVCQIYKTVIGNNYQIQVEAHYYEGFTDDTYVPEDDEDVGNDTLYPDPTVIPNIYVLDIPQIADYPPATLYVLATAPNVTLVSVDNQESYSRRISHLKTSTIGDLTTALPNVQGLDVVNSIDVTLESGSISSITQAQFDLGLNLALIGTITPNGVYTGKLINFRDVTDLGGNSYRLSYINQGLLNTGSYDTSSLPQKFFLLTGVGSYYSLLRGSAQQIGQDVILLPTISNWQDLSTTPITTITVEGNAYIPAAVENITSETDANPAENILIKWDDPSTDTSPYKDGSEVVSYEVDILDPLDAVVRTLYSSTTEVLYTLGDRTSDGITLPFDVNIYRVSSIVGRGLVSTATISSPTLVGALDGLIDADLLQGEAGAYYLDRANHTGTQTISTLSDLATVGQTNSYNDLDDKPVTRMVAKDISTNYTLQEADYKCWIRASGNITITLPSTLTLGFECAIQNVSTGTITIAANGVLESAGTTIPAQWRAAHVFYHSSNTWTATGYLI